MDNYKINVKDEAESKEAQELFVQLGYSNRQSKRFGFVYTQNGEIGCDSMEHWAYYNDLCKELTLPQLRDLVVLKRNDVKDANYESATDFYYVTVENQYYFWNGFSWILSNADFISGLSPIIDNPENKDPALISGAEAKLAWANGVDIQIKNVNCVNWYDLDESKYNLDIFDNVRVDFRLKPQTIKLELELPKPFEPKEDCHVYILDDGKTDGYRRYSYEVHGDKGNTFIGIWRTEEEIKQVVEQLRKIRGTNS